MSNRETHQKRKPPRLTREQEIKKLVGLLAKLAKGAQTSVRWRLESHLAELRRQR